VWGGEKEQLQPPIGRVKHVPVVLTDYFYFDTGMRDNQVKTQHFSTLKFQRKCGGLKL